MATVKVKLRQSKKNCLSGTVYYQMYHHGKMQQVSSAIHIPPVYWDAYSNSIYGIHLSRDPSLRVFQNQINNDMKLIRTIILEFETSGSTFTVSDIANQFRDIRRHTLFLEYFKSQIDSLAHNEKYGTARNYKRTYKSFATFLNGQDIPFHQFNEELVCAYNDWLTQRGVIRNTSSFYLRVLRAVYNKAIKQKLAPQAYPFRSVYTGVDRTRKRAINESAILRLKHIDLSRSAKLAFARDIFIFSYCTRGMAFIDIAFLRKKDIENNMIYYSRRKTGQRLAIYIEPCMREIIKRYEQETNDSPYVFPIIRTTNKAQSYKQYLTALGCYNKYLKILSAKTGLSTNLSSYCARHSWATAARNHNIPLSVISAGMGHSSEKTTQIYLDSLENSILDQANRHILASLEV